MAYCNYCGTGAAEFVGHIFSNKTAKIYSRFMCTDCGALFEIERLPVGPNAFDIDHPEAHGHMLPTKDWIERETKRLGVFDRNLHWRSFS